MEHGTIKVTASQPARTEDCRLKGIRNRNEISTHFVFVWPSRTSTCDSKTNNMEKKRDYLLLKSLSVSLKKERISMTFGAVFERELESSAVERNFRGRLVDLASRLGESTWRVDLASRLGESGKPTLGRPLARRFVSEAATRRPRGRVCYSLTRPVLTHTHTLTHSFSLSPSSSAVRSRVNLRPPGCVCVCVSAFHCQCVRVSVRVCVCVCLGAGSDFVPATPAPVGRVTNQESRYRHRHGLPRDGPPPPPPPAAAAAAAPAAAAAAPTGLDGRSFA